MSLIELSTASDTGVSSHIRVSFPVQGSYLPADHGYLLYAAITTRLQDIHSAAWLGVELLSGVPWAPGVIALPARGASLHLRLPAEQFSQVLPLAGTRLEIGSYSIRLGLPVARMLLPATSLYARIVTIKKFTEPEPFLAAAQRQLYQLGVQGSLAFPQDGHTRSRRIITIHGYKVVGFSLAAHDLSETDSLKLQSVGLGGRRSMGCGIFNPIVKATWTQADSQA